ncbi:caspase family protein [Sinomonas flava]|uniref:Peptidase C14 caspase domain-containing protein n=1 Tax=Sinomonas flava TaxID=496857 RepID=A0ABP5NF25_9MICC
MARAALCIGINRFAALPEDNWLAGCVNDAHDIAAALTGVFGFAPGEVTVLTDAAATKAAILGAIGDIVERAVDGRLEQIVLTFSSHGTQIPDDASDPDEPDRMDEALAAYDITTAGDQWERGSVVVDDELHVLLSRVPAQVITDVVLDTCHSGTGLRAFDAPRGRRARFLAPPAPAGAAAAPGAAAHSLRELVASGPGPVLFAACRADQTASDAPFGGRYSGAFTHFLLEALTSQPTASRSATHQAVTAALRAAKFDQRAQLEGTAAQREAVWGR